MTASQTLKLYEIAQKYFQDKDDAKTFIQEIEQVVENKLSEKKDIFLTKEDKVDMIKWMFAFWTSAVTILGGLMIALFNIFRK